MQESERVKECASSKKVWDALQTHHEVTLNVRETRVDMG